MVVWSSETVATIKAVTGVAKVVSFSIRGVSKSLFEFCNYSLTKAMVASSSSSSILFITIIYLVKKFGSRADLDLLLRRGESSSLSPELDADLSLPLAAKAVKFCLLFTFNDRVSSLKLFRRVPNESICTIVTDGSKSLRGVVPFIVILQETEMSATSAK